jgi:hypothetical protein
MGTRFVRQKSDFDQKWKDMILESTEEDALWLVAFG